MAEESAGTPEGNGVTYPTKTYSGVHSKRPHIKKPEKKSHKMAAALKSASEKKAEPVKVGATPEAKAEETKTTPVEKAETKAPEPAPTEAKEEPGKKDFDHRFSALRKAEKRVNDYVEKQKQELAEEKRKYEEQRKQHEEELKEARALQQALKDDPYKALDHLKLDPREWARRTLGKPEQPKTSAESERVEKLAAEIEALRKERDEEKTQKEKAEKDREIQEKYNTVKNEYLDNISQVMKDDPDRYGYTLSRDAREVVWALIEQTYIEDGREMTVKEALDETEKAYEEDADLYAQAPKFQKKLSPQGGPEAKAKPDKEPKTKIPGAAPSRLVSTQGTRKERRRERKNRLIQHLKSKAG